MARRVIGQERLTGGMSAAQWPIIGCPGHDDGLARAGPAARGHFRLNHGRARPAITDPIRALLLPTWHDLSDVRLAELLDDRVSFRRFCGFTGHQATSEWTAFVNLRAELVRRGLDRPLFAVITRRLDRRGLVVRTGTLVDATVIASASIRRDHEALWTGHQKRKPIHGYKAHVATDRRLG